MRGDLIGLRRGEIWAVDGLDKTATFPVDRRLRDTIAGAYDALVIPGGVVSADHLRLDSDAVALVGDFASAAKPVGAVGHGSWLLVEAGLARGRTLTGWYSLRTDVTNAGGQWTDRGVHMDDGLLTCAGAEDLPTFCAKLIEALAATAPRR